MTKSAAQIIDRTGAQKIADAIGLPGNNVRMWKQRNRIPAEHWLDLANHKIASLEELAEVAAREDPA